MNSSKLSKLRTLYRHLPPVQQRHLRRIARSLSQGHSPPRLWIIQYKETEHAQDT